MSRLPGRSPLPSVTFAHVAARGSSRTIDRAAHLHLRSDVRDPPDLGADCRRVPVLATRFLGRVSSHGVVQRSPLHRSSRGVRVPGQVGKSVSAPPRPPFGMGMPFPSAGRPRGFSPPRRFLLHDPATIFRPLPILGFIAFLSACETEFPAMHLLPFEAFPPPTAARVRRRISVVPCGFASPVRPSPIAPFTVNLAPSSLPVSRPLAVSRRAPR
jgi:hypothetical protein